MRSPAVVYFPTKAEFAYLVSINSDKSLWDINIWNQSSRKSGICLACFWCGNFSWKLLSRVLSYFLLRSLGKKRIGLDVQLSSAVRGSDKPLVFYLLSAWFLLNDKVVFCLTFKVSLIYEWKASERPLQIKYLLVFLVEEPASCLVLRTLAGAPDQTLFWEQDFDFPGSFSFCRLNDILPSLCLSSCFVCEFLLYRSLIWILFKFWCMSWNKRHLFCWNGHPAVLGAPECWWFGSDGLSQYNVIISDSLSLGTCSS